MQATAEQRRALLRLQETDIAIARLEHRRADLAEQQVLDAHVRTTEKVAGELATADDELATLRLTTAKLENDIASLRSRRKAEEARKYSGQISSERELSALDAELRSIRERTGDREDELLEAMMRSEELTATAEKLRGRRQQLDEDAPALVNARDLAATEIDGEIAGLREQRAVHAAAVTEEQHRQYQELRRRKQGVAVAELRGTTCLGCRLDLTPGELVEMKEEAGNGMLRCMQCGRLLVPAG